MVRLLAINIFCFLTYKKANVAQLPPYHPCNSRFRSDIPTNNPTPLSSLKTAALFLHTQRSTIFDLQVVCNLLGSLLITGYLEIVFHYIPQNPYLNMVDRPKKPSALNPISPGLAPQAQVNITHSNARVSAVLPTGESVEILLYGATIISWKDAVGQEKLFLSEKAKLDGTKAVRGGIPLVFPVFGTAPDHTATAKLPQHGFARTSRWEFLGKSTSESSENKDGGDSSVKLDFGLSANNLDEGSKKAWPHEFGLIYSVTLGREGLTTSIVVRNEGETAWEFQVLMHSYLRINVRPSLITTPCLATLMSNSYRTSPRFRLRASNLPPSLTN